MDVTHQQLVHILQTSSSLQATLWSGTFAHGCKLGTSQSRDCGVIRKASRLQSFLNRKLPSWYINMFLLLCLILCAIMAIAAFALWILDALSLLYPSISPSSSSGSSSISPSSSCVQLNVGPIVLPTVLDQQQLSSAETALTCDSGLPSYEETMNPRWTEGTLDCHLNQNLCRWEPVGFELPHNYNSYFHWQLFSPLSTWSYTQQRHWLI